MVKGMNQAPARGSNAARAYDEAREAGHAEGVAEGRKAERQRVAAILRSAEAEGRFAQALTLATETDLTAEAARQLLAASPREQDGVAPLPDAGTAEADAAALWDRIHGRAED